MQSQKRILRLRAVTETTGLAKQTIYELMQRGTFPKQINLTSKAVGWPEEEIEAWKAERIAQRDAKAA